MAKGKFFNQIMVVLLVFASLGIPFAVHAETPNPEIRLQTDENIPQVIIQSKSADTLDLIVIFPDNPLMVDDPTTPGLAVFDERIYSHPAEVGVLDLPVLRKQIEIPFGSQVELKIGETTSYQTALGDPGLPTEIPNRLPDEEKCGSAAACSSPLFLDTTNKGLFPEKPVRVVDQYVVRGHQIVQLEFWPVQYEPTTNQILIHQEINLQIIASETNRSEDLSSLAKYESNTFDLLLAENVLNYSGEVQTSTSRSSITEPYLIIAPDAFLGTLSELVNLKQSQGFPVTLVGLSTTGATAQAIKNFIQNAYNTWPTPPTYVLLVGDVNNGANTMPAFIGSATQTTVTDLYYGTVDGSDWIPDIFVGRLPARDLGQLQAMIQNLKAYHNLTGSEPWVKKAALLASNDTTYWEVAEGTQNYVIQNHTQPYNYTGIFPSSPQAGGDKLYGHTYSAGNTEVINAINNGRSLIAYSGHGSRTSWGGPSFDQTNIYNITSTGAYSVVTSFACITGDFNTTESFGETWVSQPNKGAVAFIGSSASTFWGPDDAMERAMMDSLYSGNNSANIVGAFLYAGLMAVEENYPGTGTAQSKYYWEAYNLLGDPSLGLILGPRIPDFSLNASTTILPVCQGSSQTATLTLGQVNQFAESVTLSASDIPNGVSTDFSPMNVTPPGSSELTVAANTNASPGTYLLKINGDSTTLHHDLTLNLNVFEGAPSNVTLTTPADSATGIAINPTFQWDGLSVGHSYQLQVATDSDFNQIVVDQANITQNQYTMTTELAGGTTYYWRVKASNPCGTGAYSQTKQFTTLTPPGDCPPGNTPTNIYATDLEGSPTAWEQYGDNNESWALNTTRSYSPSQSFYAKNLNTVSLQQLVSPVISLPDTAPLFLKFWQWFEMEGSSSGCFDGGMLEISNDGGQTWNVINESELLTNPYSGPISTLYNNPLSGNQAWCGARDWSKTVVDLQAYAGQDVQLRFSLGTDGSVGKEGWYIDDFQIQTCESIPNYKPDILESTISVEQAPGKEVILKLTLNNAGLNADAYNIDLSSGSWLVDLRSSKIIELASGESAPLEITVTIPADAAIGQTEVVTLSVTSSNDPNAKDSATINLKATMISYIPVVTLNH